MENPCIECLVRAGCSMICRDKLTYQDRIITDLTEFTNTHIYDMNGNYIGSKSLSDKLKDYHKELLKRCDVSSKEFQAIFTKGGRIEDDKSL